VAKTIVIVFVIKRNFGHRAKLM